MILNYSCVELVLILGYGDSCIGTNPGEYGDSCIGTNPGGYGDSCILANPGRYSDCELCICC